MEAIRDVSEVDEQGWGDPGPGAEGLRLMHLPGVSG